VLVGKPAIAVGGIGVSGAGFAEGTTFKAIDNMDMVMARFARGEFDMIAVGRPVIGDHEWATKALARVLPRAFHAALLKTLA
jgi:2,4-dienoyl-CoA reductase-like NADH-dependent reductase (Old Yellow Enzyme family)